MTRIKICGITTLEDALLAAGAGADMLGFNFYRPSPRYITPGDCRAIVEVLHGEFGSACPILVGVFVNDLDLDEIMAESGVTVAQLHGDEPLECLQKRQGRAFKAIRPRDRNEAWAQAEVYDAFAPEDKRLPTLLVDAYHKDLYGGTGARAGTGVALAAKEQTPRMMLAGGLTPDNVGERIRAVRPWGVDVASGVEGDTKGRKDESCIRAFIAAVKIADAQSA